MCPHDPWALGQVGEQGCNHSHMNHLSWRGTASSLIDKAKGSSDSYFTFGWIWSSLKEDTIDSFDQPGLLSASGHHDCVFWVLVYKENQDSNFCIVICLKILNSILLGAGGVSGELWQLVSAIHEEAMVWYFVNDKDMTALNCVPHLRSVPAVLIQEQRNVYIWQFSFFLASLCASTLMSDVSQWECFWFVKGRLLSSSPSESCT
jgi:hypothetical protein